MAASSRNGGFLAAGDSAGVCASIHAFMHACVRVRKSQINVKTAGACALVGGLRCSRVVIMTLSMFRNDICAAGDTGSSGSVATLLRTKKTGFTHK